MFWRGTRRARPASGRRIPIASTPASCTYTQREKSQSPKAIYFDNEGHVLHYTGRAARAGGVELLSDGSQPGPEFRLRYELNGNIMWEISRSGCRASGIFKL